jgi:hypothetical protein
MPGLPRPRLAALRHRQRRCRNRTHATKEGHTMTDTDTDTDTDPINAEVDPNIYASNLRIHALNLAVTSDRHRFRFDGKEDNWTDQAAATVHDAQVYLDFLRDGTVPPMPGMAGFEATP